MPFFFFCVLHRCWRSKICIHPVHLCDKIRHCPQQDDELLCTFSCPYGCVCQGWAFVCPVKYQTFLYPQVRMVNASRSLLKPNDFHNLDYLVHLILSFCDIQVILLPSLLNLRTLDISYNFIAELDMSQLGSVPNLAELILSYNPLSVFLQSNFDMKTQKSQLRLIDLSFTFLKKFNSNLFEIHKV